MTKLVDAFQGTYKHMPLKEYDLFEDKELLLKVKDRLVCEILESGEETSQSTIQQKLNELAVKMGLSESQRVYLFHLIDNELHGFGPIEEALKDNAVKKIMVNSPSEIYIETEEGLFQDTTISFINEEHILKTIEKLVESTGLTFHKETPYLDIKLKTHDRLEVVLPPMSLHPIFTIKKLDDSKASLEELVANGTMTPYMGRFLSACVKAKLNIIVCGGSQTGKSNLLNALGNEIDAKERIVTIDMDNSLSLHHENQVALNPTKENNVFKIARSLLPNDIVISNLDESNVLEALLLMTNYRGVTSSMFANTPQVLRELYAIALFHYPELDKDLIKSYVYKALDVIVYLEIDPTGKKRVTRIIEINNGKLDPVFAYDKGSFILYDRIPSVYKKMKKAGIDDLKDIFEVKS